MKALLVERGKGNHLQATRKVRNTEAGNISSEGLYDIQIEVVFHRVSATRFRRTCYCAAQLSDYQNVKSLDSYKSTSFQLQRRMSFTLSRLANVPATSELP